MLILMSLIISATILVAMVVIDQPAWRVASMTAISLGLLFMASASKLRPVAGIVALIVAYALDLLGAVHGGEIATRALLYAWLFVGIPAAVSIEMAKQRLEKLIEATAPNGFRVRVFRDHEAGKLITFGGDAPKVCSLESDKPKSVMQAMSDMFVAFKNLNDCAKEMGMDDRDRANLTLDLLSIVKKGESK
jgi:hypothetical protein